MKFRLFAFVQIILLPISINLEGQIPKIDISNTSFYHIVDRMESVYTDTTTMVEKDTAVKEELFGRWEWFWRDRVDKNGGFTKYHQQMIDISKQSIRSTLKSSSSISWTPIGPATEPTPSISGLTGVAQATSIWANTSTIYVGLQGGGFWKRDGASWTNLTDNIPCFAVYDIAVDNSGKIYIATGYKPQGGTTWVNEGYGYGIFTSTDDGDTWVTDKMTTVPDEDLLMYRVLIHPTDQDTVYALSRFSVYKTVDGGDNWTELINVPTLTNNDWYVDMDFKANDPNTIYICSKGFNHVQGEQVGPPSTIIPSKLYVSTDGGASWSSDRASNITNDSDNPRYMNIATSLDDPTAVYAIYRNRSGYCTLERSTDNGQNWTRIVDDDYLYTANYIVPQLSISPEDSDNIYIGSLRPYRYDEINDEFDAIGSNLHDDTRDFYIVNSGGVETVYTGNDAGVAVSTNNGTTWTKMNDGLQGALFYNASISDIDTDLFLGGTGDCGTHRYDGTSWDNMHTAYADGGNSLIDNNDPDTMYAMANQRHYYSHDGGENWASTSQYSYEYDSPIIQHPTEDKVYITVRDSGSGIRYTTNGGITWTNYYPPSWDGRITAMAISKSDPDVFYFSRVTYTLVSGQYEISGTINMTPNGGLNWYDKSSNLGSILTEARITDVEIHPNDPDIVWICFGGLSDGKKVYQTTNGGTSWTNISHNLDNLPVIDLEYDHGNHQLFIGTDIGVFSKEYTGTSWSRMGNFPHSIATGVKLNHASGKLYASTWGRGLWETEIEGHCFDDADETISSNTTWTTDRELCKNLVIQSGTLIIQCSVLMPFEAKITVKSGATLTIDGGDIKNAYISVESGGTLILEDNGIIEQNNDDELEVSLGGVFQNILGEILLISGN